MDKDPRRAFPTAELAKSYRARIESAFHHIFGHHPTIDEVALLSRETFLMAPNIGAGSMAAVESILQRHGFNLTLSEGQAIPCDEEHFTLAQLSSLTGAKRRTVQLWAEAGALISYADTHRRGSGVHRRFSKSELEVAKALHRVYSATGMPIGRLQSVSAAIRRMFLYAAQTGKNPEIKHLFFSIDGRISAIDSISTRLFGDWIRLDLSC